MEQLFLQSFAFGNLRRDAQERWPSLLRVKRNGILIVWNQRVSRVVGFVTASSAMTLGWPDDITSRS